MAKEIVSFAFHYNPDEGTGIYYDPRYTGKTFDNVIVTAIQAHPAVRNVTVTVTADEEEGEPAPSLSGLYLVTLLLIFLVPIVALAIGGDVGLRLLFADIILVWAYALAR